MDYVPCVNYQGAQLCDYGEMPLYVNTDTLLNMSLDAMCTCDY